MLYDVSYKINLYVLDAAELVHLVLNGLRNRFRN